MSRIAILGGTGYAGAAIAAEARRRSHLVTPISRSGGGEGGVAGTMYDPALVDSLARDNDVLIIAVRAREADDGQRLLDVLGGIVASCIAHGTRLGVVGGAGSLQVSAGGPRLVDTPGFPAVAKPEALAHAEVLAALRESPPQLDWFSVSPSREYGSYAPGEATGRYVLGGDVLITAADGRSSISGADFAMAFVDEIDVASHHRARFTVGY